IELESLRIEQISFLGSQYSLELSLGQFIQLKAIAYGLPYLTQLGLYSLWKDDINLEELFQQAIRGTGIYADHLQRLLWTLEQDTQLASSFNQVLQAEDAVEIELLPAFKLESLGLVKLQGNRATPTCDLYSQYFRDRLNKLQLLTTKMQDLDLNVFWVVGCA
ncbi:MAG: AAA-like domain-containing protein, partial [Pleurocapsa sp.]